MDQIAFPGSIIAETNEPHFGTYVDCNSLRSTVFGRLTVNGERTAVVPFKLNRQPLQDDVVFCEVTQIE